MSPARHSTPVGCCDSHERKRRSGMKMLLVLVALTLLNASNAFSSLKISPRITAPMKALPVQIDANYNLAIGSLLLFGQLTGMEKVFSNGSPVARGIATVADKVRYIFALFAVFLTYQTTTLRYYNQSHSLLHPH